MSAPLRAEQNGISSQSDDRAMGVRILERLKVAASEDDVVAKAILRAHALSLGIAGMAALAENQEDLQTTIWLNLKSPMNRHEHYLLPIPNVWIDLDPSWRKKLRKLLGDDAICKAALHRWAVYPHKRVRDFGRWLARCLEAALPSSLPASPLLVAIANFRRDAALPRIVSLRGPFVNAGSRLAASRSGSNPLRSALRQTRKHPESEHSLPEFSDLAVLDDPVSRLASLLVAMNLERPSKTNRSPGRTERYSRAEEQLLRALVAGETLEVSPMLKGARDRIVVDWPELRPYFSGDELAVLEPLFECQIDDILQICRRTNAGAFNLVPPSQPLSAYEVSLDLEGSLGGLALWAFLRLMSRCGCRASDLFGIGARNFRGIGRSEMDLTLPHTKTTGRRVLPIGTAMPPLELKQFASVLGRFGSSGRPWFPLIMRGVAAERWKQAPPRWQNDFAYADFRRAIAPTGVDYLPTHTPRHAFATAFGMFCVGRILKDFDHPFFGLWTQDPAVQRIAESRLFDLHEMVDDAILLANQVMGHKTPTQFIETYCHAWPLILAAYAERRYPGVMPWRHLQKMQESA